MNWTGGCLCGAIRYEASEGPTWASYCHCAMCRRVSGAPFMSFMEFSDGVFQWTQGSTAKYESSPGIIRRFCSTCGTSLTFEADGMAFIALGSLDNPEQVEVQRHCYTRSKLPGIQLADDLPQFPGPVGGKGGLP